MYRPKTPMTDIFKKLGEFRKSLATGMRENEMEWYIKLFLSVHFAAYWVSVH